MPAHLDAARVEGDWRRALDDEPPARAASRQPGVLSLVPHVIHTPAPRGQPAVLARLPLLHDAVPVAPGQTAQVPPVLPAADRARARRPAQRGAAQGALARRRAARRQAVHGDRHVEPVERRLLDPVRGDPAADPPRRTRRDRADPARAVAPAARALHLGEGAQPAVRRAADDDEARAGRRRDVRAQAAPGDGALVAQGGERRPLGAPPLARPALWHVRRHQHQDDRRRAARVRQLRRGRRHAARGPRAQGRDRRREVRAQPALVRRHDPHAHRQRGRLGERRHLAPRRADHDERQGPPAVRGRAPLPHAPAAARARDRRHRRRLRRRRVRLPHRRQAGLLVRGAVLDASPPLRARRVKTRASCSRRTPSSPTCTPRCGRT